MEKTMNYIDAMDFLEETKKYGSQLGLTSIQNLMAELGNIQDEIPLVKINILHLCNKCKCKIQKTAKTGVKNTCFGAK